LCLGSVVSATRLLLPDAAAEGLDYVEITTDIENLASQRVVEAVQALMPEVTSEKPATRELTA